MSYEDKCLENKKTAIICYEKNYYNSCINRFYYSFYHALLNKLAENNKIKDDKVEGVDVLDGGSHQKVFYVYLNQVFMKRPKSNMREKSTIVSLFNSIKSARTKADYKAENVTSKEADGIRRTYDNLIKYLEMK